MEEGRGTQPGAWGVHVAAALREHQALRAAGEGRLRPVPHGAPGAAALKADVAPPPPPPWTPDP